MQAIEYSIFTQALKDYFLAALGDEVRIETVYLAKKSELAFKDFTVRVELQGGYNGAVYFTLSRIMLMQMLITSGKPKPDSQMMQDTLLQIGDSMKSHVLQHFGYQIKSVKVATDAPANESGLVAYADKVSVIHTLWRNQQAAMVFDLALTG